MKNFITKNPIANLVIGLLLIGLALTATFFTTWLEDAIVYIIASLIIFISIYRFYLDYRRSDDKNATIILVVELLIALAIGIYLVVNEANASRMIGFVLYLRGFTYLLTLQLLKISGSFTRFIVYMIVMTFGAYMLFSGVSGEEYLEYGVFGVVSAYGLLLIFAGIKGLQARSSKPKKPKPSKNDSTKESQ
jgi:hypothetical protein